MRLLIRTAALAVFPVVAHADPCEGRLSDFDAPELSSRGGRYARARLVRIAHGRRLDCTAVRGRSGRVIVHDLVIVHDRVIGRCRLAGRPLGDLLRAAGGQEGGR